MASMGDVPDVTRIKMSLCSCHKLQQNAFFAFKKGNIALFSRENLIVFREISNTSRGPTPGKLDSLDIRASREVFPIEVRIPEIRPTLAKIYSIAFLLYRAYKTG